MADDDENLVACKQHETPIQLAFQGFDLIINKDSKMLVYYNGVPCNYSPKIVLEALARHCAELKFRLDYHENHR